MEDMNLQKDKQQVQRVAARKRRPGEAGQALLEVAFLLPVMCLLWIGIAELGRAASATIAVNNAATAGVEYGAQNSTTANDITGMENAATKDTLGNNLPSGTSGKMTATATNGCVCDDGGGTSCSPMPAPGTCSGIAGACTGQVVQCVQVTTQLSFGPMLNYPGLPASYQANGQAVMRVRK